MNDTSSTSQQVRLHRSFTFWFSFTKKSKEKQLEEFEDNLKEIGTISTAQEFWGIYQHMKRPSTLTRGCEFSFFKSEIKPMWEDTANQNGGRFVILLKKNANNNILWENMLIALTLLPLEEEHINGLVLKVRSNDFSISVWTKSLSDDQNSQVKNWAKESLRSPVDISIDYKKHPTNEELAVQKSSTYKDGDDKKNQVVKRKTSDLQTENQQQPDLDSSKHLENEES